MLETHHGATIISLNIVEDLPLGFPCSFPFLKYIKLKINNNPDIVETTLRAIYGIKLDFPTANNRFLSDIMKFDMFTIKSLDFTWIKINKDV